jgi:hypothetical protein
VHSSIHTLSATPSANASIGATPSSIVEHIQFLHAAAFSPVTSTWIDAINNGHFTTWPGLTAEAVRKHLPKSFATAQGHLDQARKNQRSTKSIKDAIEHQEPLMPKQEPHNAKTNYVYAAMGKFSEATNMIHSNLTGHFPQTSTQGNKYVLIVYSYDGNAILAQPMQARDDKSSIEAYTIVLNRLKKAGLAPKLQRLDNEASRALKDFFDEQDIDWQLVPQYCHRRNAAERAIRTYKNHFIAGLCSMDPNFNMALWDKLIEQAELTLNLLRHSRINPNLSAYAQINGQFDFNAMPLAPPGIRILAHDKLDKRASWAPHGEDGWYISPAMKHYRCFHVYINKTKSERVVDMVEFFPSRYNMPKFSSSDAIIKAAKDMIQALREPHPATPFNNFGDQQLAALQQLADIFATALLRVDEQVSKRQAIIQPTQEPESQRPRTCSHEQQANAVLDPNTGKYLEYNQLIKHPKLKDAWNLSSANEFGRLMQGVGGCIKGTNAITIIHKNEVPKGKKATYGRFVCLVRPQKEEENRTRLTVGGNLIDYPGNKSAKTADVTTVKCLANSVISTQNARAMCMDLKNFYLGTPMRNPEFIKIHIF